MKPARRRLWSPFSTLSTAIYAKEGGQTAAARAVLTLCLGLNFLPAMAEEDPAPTPIPFSEIGAKATAGYQGDAIGIEAKPEGARLHTGFQKLSASVTREGLWLNSTEEAGGSLHLVAGAIGREGAALRALPAAGAVMVGDKTVTFQRPGLTEEFSVSADGVRQDRLPAGPCDLP